MNFGWPVADLRFGLAPEMDPTGICCRFGLDHFTRFALYDALIQLDDDGNLLFRLAQSMSGAGAHWTLKLRDGLLFSDGTPMDAAAVKAAWDRWAEPNAQFGVTQFARRIESTTVLDPTTLDVTLVAPDDRFPRLVAQTVLSLIPSPTAVSQRGSDFGAHPVGAGAFELEDYQPGVIVRLRRNERYALHRPYLDRLNINFITDEAVRLDDLKSGAIDLALSLDEHTLAAADSLQLSAITYQQNGGEAVVFNTSRAPFNDLRARRAFALMLSFDKLNHDLFGGRAQPARTLFAEASPYFADTRQPENDASEATQLINELGGLSFHIAVQNNPADREIASWIQGQAAQVPGADAQIDVIDTPIPLLTGDFDAAVFPRFFGDPYPTLDAALRTGAPGNIGRFDSEAGERALQNAVNATTEDGRRSAYADLSSVVAQELPMVFLFRVPLALLYADSRVGNVPVLNGGIPDWSEVWLR